MTKKIITVFGATGAQGGGLAHAILDDKSSEFSVRAVTRNPESDKAKDLAAKGAEIISADIDDKQSLKRALEGAYGAYFVTFYWAHFSPEKEYNEAKHLAEAARDAGIQHAIWSTLEDTRKWVPLEDDRMPTLMGKYKVPHFDAKGEADQLFTDAGVPVTFQRASFYWDNFIYFGSGPKKGPDGKLYLTFPLDDKKMAGIASEDIGKCAYGVFKRKEEMIGKTIGVAGEHLSGEEMAHALSKAIGQEVLYNNVTPATYRAFGFPGADDLGNMFQFYRDFEEVCNSDGIYETEEYSDLACWKDNYYTFRTNGELEINEGVTKCDAGDPQTYMTTWRLDSNETVLVINVTSYLIEELNNSTLRVKLPLAHNRSEMVTYIKR